MTRLQLRRTNGYTRRRVVCQRHAHERANVKCNSNITTHTTTIHAHQQCNIRQRMLTQRFARPDIDKLSLASTQKRNTKHERRTATPTQTDKEYTYTPTYKRERPLRRGTTRHSRTHRHLKSHVVRVSHLTSEQFEL